MVAGVAKGIRPTATAQALYAAGLPASGVGVRGLGVVEVAVGVAALLRPVPAAGIALAALYAGFAAFIAYLSSLTNINYSATQYALFSSMMLLLPKFIAGYSGVFVDRFGYISFFTSTALLGLPVLVLVALAGRARTAAAKG